uniref:Putative DNA polymerase n=2 Tax=viral metagenome TaxID=1070528 RepID=A0A6M3K3K0_9ZZZZ
MKFTTTQENLSRGLATVGRAVASKSTLPVLSNVLMDATNGALTLSATNLEIGIRTTVHNVRIDEPGQTTIPARLLTEFVNQLPAGSIDAVLTERTQSLNLRNGHHEANIKGMAADEFPTIAGPDQFTGWGIELQTELFQRMVGQTAFAAATDESRPILTGVFLDLKLNHIITMAAADGFRLAVTNAEYSTGLDVTQSLVIPATSLAEAARLATGDTVTMRVRSDGNQLLFDLGDTILVSQLIEGRFPDYTQIVPKIHTTRVVMARAALTQAVRTGLIFAKDAANILKLAIGDGQVTVSAESSGRGDNESELDAVVEGPGLEIALNARYLLDALTAAGTERVTLELMMPHNPGVIRGVGDDGYLSVLMPMMMVTRQRLRAVLH